MMFPSTFAWFIIYSTTAYGNVMFLRHETNATVEIPCEFPYSTKFDRLFAFALRRKGKSKDVLYLNINSKSPVTYKDRISVQNLLRSRKANVNITRLQENDTDIYWCLFYYDYQDHNQLKVNGSTEFFLYVEAPEQCSCSNLLLYALSVAALLLFFCVLFLTGAYYKKPTVQPIYEDMKGIRSPNRVEH